MEERILEFIGDLRRAEIRISTAEALDALGASAEVGLTDRETFKATLASTLIKEARDEETFNRIFNLYFLDLEALGEGLKKALGPEDPRPPRRRPRRRPGGRGRGGAGGQRAALAPHHLAPALPGHPVRRRRPVPAPGGGTEFFIFDFGDPDYFAGGVANEVPPEATAIACNLTVTSGTSGGNLRAFPGNSDVIPLVSSVNWVAGQTVANFAIVAAATPNEGDFQASVGLFNASTRGSVHVIVDISGYFV